MADHGGRDWQLIVIDPDGVAEVLVMDSTVIDDRTAQPFERLDVQDSADMGNTTRVCELASVHLTGTKAIQALFEFDCTEVDLRPLLGVAELDQRPTAIYRERARLPRHG